MKRASGHEWVRTVSLMKASRVLMDVEARLDINQPVCVVSTASAVWLTKRPLSWWKQYACSGNVNAIRYYYVIERLAQEECHVITDRDLNLSADYFRITLLALPDNIKGAKIRLQTTIARATGQVSLCQDKMRMITPGRQMQREI